MEGRVTKVEVILRPANRRVVAQVGGNGPDNGGPNFSFTGTDIRFGRHSEVGTQDVDALLALLLPVVRQPGHRIHAGESNHRLVVSELLGCGAVPLGEQARVRPRRVSLTEPLFTVDIEPSQHSCQGRHQRQRDLNNLDGCSTLNCWADKYLLVEKPAKRACNDDRQRRCDPYLPKAWSVADSGPGRTQLLLSTQP